MYTRQMIHNKPFYSQHSLQNSPEWRKKACTLTCLYMALGGEEGLPGKTLDSFLEEALSFGVFDEASGGYWNHKKISLFAHLFGVPAYPEEFRSRRGGEILPAEDFLRNYAYEKFTALLDRGVSVIFSMPKEWTYLDKYHSALLTGYKKEAGVLVGFYYSDPDSKNDSEGKNLFVSLNQFSSKWRGLAIIIGKDF